DYQDLKESYQNYQLHDLGDETIFFNYINKVTLQTSLAVVMIRTTVFNALSLPIETRYGSGFIFHEKDGFHYVLTTYDVISDHLGSSAGYDVYDYLEYGYTSTLRYASETDNLAVLSIAVNQSRPLNILSVTNSKLMMNEPVLLIGYQRKIINALTMGTYLGNDDYEDVNYMRTDIPTDVFGSGGVVINSRHEVIGLQVFFEDTFQYCLRDDAMDDFIHDFLETL
ncbi:MAG: trypsin-like peptidase domain-containing protein, partial [Acholeplasmataceae bacterium]|nr:trypsin-like peptidase domain-containing protein [Acholeplasmataceae bacterium]